MNGQASSAREDSWIERRLRGIARASRTVLRHSGQLGLLTWRIVLAFARFKVSWRAVTRQMYAMGIESVPIVLVTGSLAGIVTSQQGG